MVFTRALSAEERAYIAYLVHDKNVSVKDISSKTGVSAATIYRLKETKIGGRKHCTRTPVKHPGGRPKKLTTRDERHLLRCIPVLREEEGNFCTKRLMQRAGLSKKKVSDRTVRRCLNENGYYYLQARKKGLMTKKDQRKRRIFAKQVQGNYSADVWISKVAFYLDGVSLFYKRNPADQARAPKGRIWREKCEGLSLGCTAKGSKEGSGGKVLKLMVAISYGKGVLMCHPYEYFDGPTFAAFVREKFPEMFRKAGKKGRRIFVQDNDPVQNSGSVRRALNALKAKQLKIPPRSPDVNPIENLFHSMREKLRQQALKQNITHETFREFSDRVTTTLNNFSIAEIDKTIESMNNRLQLIKQSHGQRIKY